MALLPLHKEMSEKRIEKFPDWKFVHSSRSLVRKREHSRWFLHVTFANHVHDFDVVADVAVEHLLGKHRICIVGAELGNIQGTGQHRWGVDSPSSTTAAAHGVETLFNEIGTPFLDCFSSIEEVLRVYRMDREMARLINPFEQNPQVEAERIASITAGQQIGY